MTTAEDAYRVARSRLAQVLHGDDETARAEALADYLATLQTLRPLPSRLSAWFVLWAPSTEYR